MPTMIANKYTILEIIGEGTFGKVFKGINIRSNEQIAIKIQHKDIINVLKHEAKIYKYLKDISGIPLIRNYGTEHGFNYLIIDLLDISLSEKNFTHIETIKYMITAIKILEKIHTKGIIHRDIKPENFLLKKRKGIEDIYIIDFGLSKYYLDGYKKHMIERKDRKLIGTAKFVSLNIHNGIEASRRDDLESLCYVFITIYGKELPWTKLIEKYNKENKNESNSANKKNLLELYNEIKIEKEKSLEWLYDIPGEFLTMILYCRTLKFDEMPNYKYLSGLFKNLLTNSNPADICNVNRMD
jgi:serine/threonine protein kinase